MKFIFKYSAQGLLVFISCFASISLSKSSKSKLKDILSGTASNIRPGMLTNSVYSSEAYSEKGIIRAPSEEFHVSSPSEMDTFKDLSRKVDVRKSITGIEYSALRTQSANSSTIRTAGIIAIITFSIILILFNK